MDDAQLQRRTLFFDEFMKNFFIRLQVGLQK